MEFGGNCTVRSFITCTVHHTLLGGSGGWDIWHMRERSEAH